MKRKSVQKKRPTPKVRLMAYMEQHNISVARLAAASGRTERAIRNLVNGQNDPQRDTRRLVLVGLKKLATQDGFPSPPDDILT